MSLPELPKQYRDDCDEYWLEAIVLVRKQNLSNSYAVAKRGADGKIVYKADFGDVSPISGLISIHPYMYLNKSVYMPFENIDQMRQALIQYIGADEEAVEAVEELPDSEVEYQMLQIAIEAQYSGESIKETHQAILDAVGVTPKSTISFESENEGTDRTDASSEKTDEADKGEPDNTETSDIDRPNDGDKVVCDGNGDNTNENAQTIEPIPEEKPKNKGGRPKGSRNTTTKTTRRTTKK
ncbi:MAG: hypothetical protein ACI4GX_04300 [Ruminococcus sp.]